MIYLTLFVGTLLTLPVLPAMFEWWRRRDAGALIIEHGESEAAPQAVPTTESLILEDQEIDNMSSRQSIDLLGMTTVRDAIHAEGVLRVGGGVHMQGTASSATRVVVRPGSTFERLKAPIIVSGDVNEAFHMLAPKEAEMPRAVDSAPEGEDLGDAILVRGDLTIPASRSLSRNLVIHGDLILDAGARLVGNIKCSGSVHLEAGAGVSGNVVADEDIMLSTGSWISGVVLSSRLVKTSPRTIIGSPEHAVSLVGETVKLAHGTTVYGVVVATARGMATEAALATAA